MQEFDSAVAELFKSGMMFLVLSLFAYMFDKEQARLLRNVSYLCFLSFILTIVFTGLTLLNNLVAALNKLSEWSFFKWLGH